MSPESVPVRPVARHGWVQAAAAVLTGLAVMVVLAALGLWAAGAADLPDGAFARVVMATVVAAVGGTLELSGNAGVLAETRAGLTVIPLSVTLAGALVIGAGFLRPLRHRAVASARELAGWAARIAVLWLLALLGLAFAARQTFAVDVGNGTLSDLTGLFDAAPKVGFTTDVPLTVLFGLVWLAGVLVLTVLVAPGAPLPGRLLRRQESVRPAAYAMVVLLLVYVALGLVVALVSAVTRGHVAETFAVILLGLPNLVWLALTLGLGATWNGRVEGPFGLPMPHVLDQILRTPDVSTLNLRTLTAYDTGMWWLMVTDVVVLSAVAFLMAARSPARVRAWQHALRLAVALALTVLMICLLCRVSAHYGLSLLGIGELGGGLSGELFLRPQLWQAVGLGALWGLAAGFLGALLARPVHRRGRVETP
ncbi:streptophobe family protein [Streptomyces diastatochromogenes]|uniref:streptophobe family protein n=1 Tax=Streptomyces diastatochromogenes TaxID=42236 RepID=UPI000B91BF25|nr:streptophobe family protein [Streptomyces diastatochromogenes]MCZ0991172.1 streptophobe family protein [Streptomyces diastatochromogenes]